MLIDVPDLGPTPCKSIELVLNKGKTNQVARKDSAAFIRAKDVTICPVGALGLYFFQRFAVNQESFPDLSERQNWYQIKVFVSETSEVRHF
jgi:hypothetical protein